MFHYDAELLRRELRAARDDEFLRLARLSVDDLETHIDRLERDRTDLTNGIDHPDD